jgi:Rps23 Pro-64 3,4-dihydroxylase Tpa1-like proline 4-hydroxylase
MYSAWSVLMDINCFPNPFPHAILDNFYETNELHAVWRELEFLTHPYKLLSEDKTGSSFYADGTLAKKNFGIYLDETYAGNRNISDILRISRKIFDPELLHILQQHHWLFKYVARCNKDTMMLSYYEDKNNYNSHIDDCTMTSLVHLFKQPRKFSGGDLVFPEFGNYTLTLQNNRCILFPSKIEHAVTPLSLPEEDKMTGNGRYCISHFFHC